MAVIISTAYWASFLSLPDGVAAALHIFILLTLYEVIVVPFCRRRTEAYTVKSLCNFSQARAHQWQSQDPKPRPHGTNWGHKLYFVTSYIVQMPILNAQFSVIPRPSWNYQKKIPDKHGQACMCVCMCTCARGGSWHWETSRLWYCNTVVLSMARESKLFSLTILRYDLLLSFSFSHECTLEFSTGYIMDNITTDCIQKHIWESNWLLIYLTFKRFPKMKNSVGFSLGFIIVLVSEYAVIFSWKCYLC